MTRHLRSVVIVTAILLLGGAVAPAATGSQARKDVVDDGRTQPVFSYRSAVRETVYVRSSMDADRDGSRDLVATDIIRPRETETGGLRVPVIYENSPYYQLLGRGNESETKQAESGDFAPEFFPLFYDNYFVPRGYAVVLQDMSGTRNSEGCMVLGGRSEVAAARSTIDWLNGRGAAFTASGQRVHADWSTGKVGMIGKSYDGTIANAVAATGVEGLETIVPIGAISRWYDYHLNNGVQYTNAYLTPALFSFLIDQTPADDEERRRWAQATFGRSTVCQATGTEIVAKAADPRADYTQFWTERDYLRRAERVSASVFLVHGLNDFNVKPNHFDQWWRALAANDVPRKLWLARAGHVDPFDFRRRGWVRTLHGWFDHWLHGIDNGVMADPMADVERAAGEWRRYATWPARSAAPVTLNLGSAEGRRPGVLVTEDVAHTRQQTYRDDPKQSERDMASHRFAAKPSRLLFLSPRLTRRIRMSGTPTVSMHASVDRTDTNFTALLVDYGTDRRVDHESSGGVRTTPRQSCHGRSTAADDACYFTTRQATHRAPYEIVSRGWLDARHRGSLREGEDLSPGRGYRFRWEVFAEDYVFKRGHRLGFVIAGSDADYTVPDPFGATVTVQLGRSRLRVPIVGGQAIYADATSRPAAGARGAHRGLRGG